MWIYWKNYLQWFYLKDAVRWKAAEFNVKGTDPLGYQLDKYKMHCLITLNTQNTFNNLKHKRKNIWDRIWKTVQLLV